MQSWLDLRLWIGKEGKNRESEISLAQVGERSNQEAIRNQQNLPRSPCRGNLRERQNRVERISDAKNHSLPVVRQPSRRGDEFLRFYFQEFKSCESHSLWRRRSRTEGNSHVRDLSTRRPNILCPQRRPAVQLYAGHIALRELRDPAGS